MSLPILARFPGIDADGFGTVDVNAAVPHDARGTVWEPFYGVLAPQRPGGTPAPAPVRLARGYEVRWTPRCPP